MFKVVRKIDAKMRTVADNKLVLNYIDKEISPNCSFAITKAENYFEAEFAKYDRIYFVLNGELKLSFNSEQVVLQAGDSCFVAKGSKYSIEGSFEAVIVNQPAYGT